MHGKRSEHHTPPVEPQPKRLCTTKLHKKFQQQTNDLLRLEELQDMDMVDMTPEQLEELDRLHKAFGHGGDTYDEAGMTVEHSLWKQEMNDVFSDLLKRSSGSLNGKRNVVYLEGLEHHTTRTLRARCSTDLELWVCNREADTVDHLQSTGLIDHLELGDIGDLLGGKWKDVCFSGVYLDMCSGTLNTILPILETLFATALPRNVIIGVTILARDTDGEQWLHRVDRIRQVVSEFAKNSNRTFESVESTMEQRWVHGPTTTRFFELS